MERRAFSPGHHGSATFFIGIDSAASGTLSHPPGQFV